jgi:hypothetical protein
LPIVKLPIACIIPTRARCRQICRRLDLPILRKLLGLKGWRSAIARAEIARRTP